MFFNSIDDDYYGLIHECIRQMILETLGEQPWKEILQSAGFVSGKENIINQHYPDLDTYAIIDSITRFTKKRKEEVWEWFGQFFVKFSMANGYSDLLQCTSPNLKDFLNNLDNLHYFFNHIIYKANLQGPSFRCEDGEDGTILLHYYSCRNALYPIVKGILEELARLVFQMEIDVVFQGRSQRSVLLATHERIEEHVTFLIKLNKARTPNSAKSAVSFAAVTSPVVRICNESCRLRATQSDLRSAILPYHLIIDQDSNLAGWGDNLCQFINADLLRVGTPILRIFRMYRPQLPLDYENICAFINAVYVLEVRVNTSTADGLNKLDNQETRRPLMLKGQMMRLSASANLLFICTPYASSVAELGAYGAYLNQIPAFDVARDLIILNQQRLADVEINLKLETNVEQLKSMASDLQNEKSISDALLKEMLPPTVAAQLLAGTTVDAREYEEVTVFKVETVGETYMTVCGLPEYNAAHCEKICHVALGMLWEARTVADPVAQQPLRVRCGIHTGNVVAGVVGVRMPRFCLFGDTVNTSARMESHAPEGRIHCSEEAKLASLRTGRFEFAPRGIIPIKGKGLMHTSFLVRSSKKSIWEITGRSRDEQIHSIDGYAELIEGMEDDLQKSKGSKCCTIS